MCHPVVLTLITNVNDITPNFILVYVYFVLEDTAVTPTFWFCPPAAAAGRPSSSPWGRAAARPASPPSHRPNTRPRARSGTVAERERDGCMMNGDLIFLGESMLPDGKI